MSEQDIEAMIDVMEALKQDHEFTDSFAEFVRSCNRHPPQWRVVESPCTEQCDRCRYSGFGDQWCDWRWWVEDLTIGTHSVDRVIAFGFASREQAEAYMADELLGWCRRNRAAAQ
jgi:hypothetical protein